MANLERSFLEGLDISDGGLFEFHRQQFSRTGGGSSLVKELADPLWSCAYETTPMLLQEAMGVEAQLLSLNGAVGRISLYDVRRPIPLNSDGTGLGSRTIATIGSNRHEITLGGSGFSNFSLGDMLSFEKTINNVTKRYLHKVTQVNGALSLRVWPAISTNVANGQAIELDKPFGKFQIDPDSVNTRKIEMNASNKQAVVSFSAMQVIE